MRLVSACYPYFHPFDNLVNITEFASAEFPGDLRHGDVLVVWGGADIWPGYYNKELSRMSHADTNQVGVIQLSGT